MNKSWRRFAERLLIAGISFFLLGILQFEQLFTEDWIRVALALGIGILFIILGIIVKKWEKKKAKKQIEETNRWN